MCLRPNSRRSRGAEEVAGARTSGHQEDVLDPDIDEGLDRVVDHRPVVHRQEVLVGDLGQRVQAGAETAGKDDALHGA
jgi:hypothetical protein